MPLPAGSRLGPFQIASLIGAGGMGEVYRATDTRLGREVALKVLPPQLADDPERRARFEREARAVSALNHPNICTIHDVGRADGVDYICFELVEGRSLVSLATGDIALDALLDIALPLADALDYAHRLGIVHRDLKPTNVMVSNLGVPKILDFGLARTRASSVGADAETTVGRTHIGAVVGTAPYMSPEQALGREVDSRSDVFAFGCVLYELATGQAAFRGASQTAILDRVLHDDPVPLSRLRPDLPASLELVVNKALRKDPRERYQHMSDLAADLRHLRRESAEATQASPWGARPASQTARPSSTRHLPSMSASARRRTWRALAVATPVLIAVIAVALWFTGRSPALSFAPRDWVLVADFDNQTGNPLFDRSLQAAFLVGLEQSTHANVVPRTRVAAALRRMGKPDTQAVGEELGREICIRENIQGLVRCGIGRVGHAYSISARLIDPQSGRTLRSYLERADTEAGILDALGRVSEAVRRDLGESLAAIGQANRPLPQVTTSSLEALNLYVDARQLWGKGEYKQATTQMEAALQRDPDFAMAHAFLGSAYLSHVFSRVEQGKRHAERALELASRTTDRERAYIQAVYQHDLGRLDEAAQSYALYLRNWPDDLRVRSRLADLLRQTGRLDEAIREYQELVRLAPADAASPYINMATSYTQSQHYREAIDAYRKGFALEPDAITSGTLNHEYGFTLVKAGERDEARKVFALALEQPETRARGLRSLGLLDLFEGKHGAAAARFEEAALDNEARKNTLSAARDHLFLAIVRDGQGDVPARLRELEKAASFLEGYTPPVWMVARLGAHFARAGAGKRASQLLARVRAAADRNDVRERGCVHFLEGEVALAGGRLDEAARALELAEREVAANARAEVLSALARAARARKGPDATRRGEALVEDEKSVGWEPQQDWLAAHYHLASAYARAGDVETARRRLGTLLALWKDADAGLPLLRQAKTLATQLEARRR